MMYRTLTIAGLLFMFSAGACAADSLVITYRSGKTQIVVLDEPSTAVSSWQFMGSSAVQQAPAPPAATKEITEPQQKEKTEKNPKIRVKWNAKPIPD